MPENKSLGNKKKESEMLSKKSGDAKLAYVGEVSAKQFTQPSENPNT
jgi:hypothetical protein